MSTMRDIIDRENIRHLVARDITCQQTGRVLDERTCAVVRDGDGDPIIVLDPSCLEDRELVERIEGKGWTVARQGK